MARGKDQLVIIRPYKEGLLLHQIYYADEVRAFDEIDVGDAVSFKPGEPDLADQLISQLSAETFSAEKYRDEYRDRVMAAVEAKVAGHEITAAPEQPIAQIVDLFDALKASLGPIKAGGAANSTTKIAASAKKKGPKKASPKKTAKKKAG
jgi:DNA end-binding protein Ku